jgi:hypothetical protein
VCCDADCSSGSSSLSNPVLSKTTLARLQSAGRQFLLAGRATTGPKPFRGAAAAGTGAGATFARHDVLAVVGAGDASRRFGDSAAVAALKGAVQLDPAAPLRCPAALLLNVAGGCAGSIRLNRLSRWQSQDVVVCTWALGASKVLVMVS